MAEHDHGKMNIEPQERTFESFTKIVAYSVIGIIVFLLFLALVGG
jgi:hypothetical protein